MTEENSNIKNIGRILVIDDDPATTEVLTTQLKLDGHEVEFAYTGAKGLEMFDSGEFEVVLTDLQIGDMTGIDVLKYVRSKRPQTSVIILTGYASTESAVNAVKLGANDYLLKPLKLLNLSQSVFNQMRAVQLTNQVQKLNHAVSIERDKLRHTVAELVLLKRLAEKMASAMSFIEGFDVILNLLVEEIEADVAMIYDLERKGIKLASSSPISISEAEQLADTLNGRARDRYDLEVNCSTAKLINVIKKPSSDHDSRLKSIIVVPLNWKNKPFGLLLAGSRSDEHYEADLSGFIAKLASNASEFLFRIRESVERQRHFTASIVEHTLDGIVVIDPSTDETTLNPIAHRMLNLFAGNVKPRNVAEQLNIDLSEIAKDLRQLDGSNGSSKSISRQTEVERDGRKEFFGLTVSQLPASNGEGLKMLLVIHDVTKERSVEAMKNQLVSNITHEVRTPTGVIREFISLLSDGVAGDLTDTQQQYMKIMKSNIDRLGRLIDNLLTFARTDTGSFSVVLQPIQFAPIVREVSDSMEVKLDRKNIKLRYHLPEDIPFVYADRDAVTQILTNLVDNAFKYSPENTEVNISMEMKGNRIVIEVADQGYGISPADQDSIFQRFRRLVDTNDPRFQEGVGIGLSLVKELVAKHGGDIWLKSKEGEGSSFFFSLQIAKEDDDYKPA